MKLILEQRYLFDGSAAAVGHHAFSADHHHADGAAAWDHHQSAHGEPSHAATPPAFDQPTARQPGAGETVLFVDQTVTDWQALVAGVKPGVDVVVLNPNQDGIDQVTQVLASLNNVKSVEFLTDGTPGSITLGDTTLDAATLAARGSEITGWSAHLATNATVAFWGCDVGEGSVGQAFVADVHTLTGATVAASSEPVGSAALGGSWDLDVTTGPLHGDINPFTKATLASYTGVLDTPVPYIDPSSFTVTPGVANTASGTVLLGDTLSVSLTFQNDASAATGYAPYVEIFAQTGLTYKANSASSGVTELTPVTVTNGNFTNPFTKATDTAPAGFTDGTLYIFELPYGSFTVGEPAVSMSAIFQMASTPTLYGTTLTLDARGGFEYGSSATGTGTAGADIEGASVGATDTVELVESYATVNTLYGEDETATGPDFPVQYVVHLLTAPAVTSSTPISDLQLALQLPSDVVYSSGENYSGTPLTASGGGTASVTSASLDGGTVQTLNISYATLSASQTIELPVYVPEYYQFSDPTAGTTVGDPILSQTTGAPVEVQITPPYTFTIGPWSSDAITVPAQTGVVAPADFEAKALAVQLSANTSDQVPGGDITYTMKFEISDYFGASNLALNALMSDGLTFDPTVAPALSVTAANGGVGGSSSFALTASNTGTYNSETVQTSGGGTNWSYAFDSASGTTAITFNAGGQLPGMFGAGTVGSVTFAGTILQSYPNGHDNVTGAGGFLRETDTVNTSSQASNTNGDDSATLYNFTSGSGYSAAIGTMSDDTDTPVDTLPSGALTLQVVEVDGSPYVTGETISPGDTVVYQLVYTLPEGGNFANFDLAAYLPEPVFSAINPANPDGTGTVPFTDAGANVALAALASGNYTYSLTSILAGEGVTITGGTGSEPSNSVAFQAQLAGTSYYFDSTPGQAQQSITIDLAVTASSDPFINGLHLTAQGDSTFTPAKSATFSKQTTAQVQMGEPSLSVEQGVVSIIDDANNNADTASGITWSNGASVAPTAVFSAAGSTGSIFTSGTGPASLTAADDNLNLAGAQAGDTVRIVDAVQNTGSFPAYDVVLKDALSQAFTTTDVNNLNFTLGNGTVLTVLNPATGQPFATTADEVSAYFSTGVLLVNGGSTANAVLAAAGAAPNTATGDIVYATYDVTLPADTPSAATLTGAATVVAWTNQDVFPAAGLGTVTGSTYPLLDSSSTDENFADNPADHGTLTDGATISTRTPTVTDTITGASDTTGTGATVPTNTLPGHAATLVPGETVDLSATVTLPQGQSNNVTLSDIVPTGLTPITTAGSYTVTLIQGGSSTTLPSTDVTWTGHTMKLTLPDASALIPEAAGGDQLATVVVTYQAIVPNAAAIDTSTTATPDVTLKDTFAASGEGLKYNTTTASSTATTTGSGSKTGVENDVTVTNPVLTSTLTELGGTAGQTVYSDETLTYQVTLTNSSTTATAYDAGTAITLPSGLAYVAGSLTDQTGGATLEAANIGSDGAAANGNAIDYSIAPGATVTFTFEAKVDPNLTAATALQVSSQANWNSLPANAVVDTTNANTGAQSYYRTPETVQNTLAAITPSLSVVGSSNDTAGLGTAGNNQLFDPNGQTTPTPVTVTDGEIVRMRSTLQIPEGENSNVTMTVTLPTGLTLDPNYATDGSVTVLLVSPGQDVTTSLTGTQLLEGAGGITGSKLDLGTGADTSDPVAVTLPASAISVSGQTVTIDLGTLANNDGSALPNYAIVEFNTVVGAVAGGTTLNTTMAGSANAGTPAAVTTATVNDYITVDQPTVTLAKQITGISYNNDGSATVTYKDTITNTGDGPADGTLTDPGAGVGTIGNLSTSGTATSVTQNTSGASSLSLNFAGLPGSGGVETVTYTVNIPQSQVANAVSDATSQANVAYNGLNPAHEVTGKEVLTGTSLTPFTQTVTASAGLDVVSGTVNQDGANTEGTDAPLVGLDNQTVSVTFTGQTVGTESVLTGTDGSYAVLVPDAATSVTVTASATGSHAPANDVLDNLPATAASLASASASATGTNPVVLTFKPASDTNYTGIAFDFWTSPDTKPLLAGGPSGTATITAASTPVLLFPAATVTDPQLDTSFSQDFSGTTLTLQRYVAGSPSPNAGDTFSGSGSTSSGLYLNTTNHEVFYNGSEIGLFTETGGKLTISFASTGVSQTLVDNVLQGLTYSFIGAANPPSTGVIIGMQIDDANNDPVALNGNSLDPSGPHDQGAGGDLLSNLLTATLNIEPPTITPGLSVVGSSNDTAGLGTQFDPNGMTSGTSVLTTDAEIVRMRATLALSEGDNTGVSMTVTLPTGLTFQNDSSVTLLLVSPNGDLTPVTLSVSGGHLQLAEDTGVNTSKLDLGTGADTSDPVVTELPSSAISVSGQTVTFNLGELTNNDGMPTVPNYAIVEFNAIVGANVAGGTSLVSTMTGHADGSATATVSDYINVEAPDVALSKQVTEITYNPDGSATITYVDTITNTGDGPAYGVNLTDPGAGLGTVGYVGTSGNGTGITPNPNGSSFDATLSSLPTGGSQNFTYTVTIPASAVNNLITNAASTATVTSSPLNPAHEVSSLETLAGTTETPPTEQAHASAGLDAVSGTVNQDTAATEGTDSPLVGLDNQTVNVTFTGQTGTETLHTGTDGSYTVLVPNTASLVTITANATGPNAPANDVLDNHPSQTPSLLDTDPSASGINPVTLRFTPVANTTYAGVAFDFWHTLDTAPVLSGAPTTPASFTTGNAPVTLYASGTAGDHELNTAFENDFSGTTLTIQRYVSGTAAPNAGDLFTGSGSATAGLYLNTVNGQVLYNGTEIGTFTETGGKLTVSFASSGVNNTIVNDVLQGLAYNFTGTAGVRATGVTIGAQIDDANNDPIGLNGVSPDPAGPHDQGPGGDLVSNLLLATVDVQSRSIPPPTNPTPPAPPAAPPPNPYPDDQTYNGDPNFGHTDDLLNREIIPELSLIGAEADHYVIVEQQAIIALPPNMFEDSLPNAELSFEAKRPDGSPLPSWLSFDPTDLTFYGTPPESAVGRVDIVITATDIVNNTADAGFSILVGHKESDLIGLISGRRPGGISLSPGQLRNLHLGDAAPADHGVRVAHHAAQHDAAAAPAHRQTADQTHRPAAKLGGLSGALRAAGPMGALSRARALLDVLDSLNQSRPAA